VLSRPPARPEVSELKDTVEQTVDETERVTAVAALSFGGRTWQCYIGQQAVAQRIISADFLGECAREPNVG
jgi:hypothetical protein